MPGALALVAASAIGSFLGSRLGARPLAVAAGATALAWLSRNRAASPASGHLPPVATVPAPSPVLPPAPALAPVAAWVPAPPPEAAAPVFAPAPPAAAPFLPAPADPAIDPRIQAWLARQIDREERAAAQENIILSEPDLPAPAAPWLQPEHGPADTVQTAPATAPFIADTSGAVFPSSSEPVREEHASEEDDDYRPEPLVADPPAEQAAWQAHSFAGLTEPRPAPLPLPGPTPASQALRPMAAWAPAEVVAPELVASPPVLTPLPPEPETQAPPWPPATPEPEPEPEEASRPVFSTSAKPPSQPLPGRRPPTAPLAAPFIAASAIPGIEPLPSWSEITERPPPSAPTPSSFPFTAAAAATPPPDLSSRPINVGVDLESLFDTPVFQGSPLPDEIHVTEPAVAPASGSEATSASAPLFTAGPRALSTPPTFQEEGGGASMAATASMPPPSPWLSPPNTPIFAEAPPAPTAPSPWAPPSVAAPSTPLTPPPATPAEDRMAGFFRSPEPQTKTEPASPATPPDTEADTGTASSSPVPEIAVHVAAAGEAWFDSPLAAAGVPNPWLPPKDSVEGADVPLTSSFAPLTPSSPSVTVVDAEVVLRPRAPTQTSVVPKHPPSKPPVVDASAPDAVAAEPSEGDVPVPSPREQRGRATWRSWWKGD